MCRETPPKHGFVRACSNRFFGWAYVGMCVQRREKKVGRLFWLFRVSHSLHGILEEGGTEIAAALHSALIIS